MRSPITHRRLAARSNEEAERRERRLRLAFTNAPSPLGCRPEPRSRFDKVVSDGRRPWRAFAEPLRDVALAAKDRGPAVRQQVEDAITEAVIALVDYILEPMQDSADAMTYLAVSKELPEAAEAIMLAEMLPTPEHIADAERESAEGACALTLLRGTLRRRATSTYMRPMGAPPVAS